jgi:hypothetical protein
MTKQKKTGLLKKLFGGSHNSCCSVELEEVDGQKEVSTPKASDKATAFKEKLKKN